MTTSGTNTFTQVKNQIIELAYSRAGILTDENVLTAYQVQRGSDLLNIMIKALIAQGVTLWKQAQGTLFLVTGQQSYVLDGTTANATEDFVEAETTAAAISGATSIDVDDASEMSIGYFIGIMQDDGVLHWTTISNIAGDTVTLTDALTDDVAEGNSVFAYETKINRPENILNAQCFIGGGIYVGMQLLARDTYDAIAIPAQQSIPTQLYYNKQRTFGQIKIFGTSPNESYRVRFTFQKQFFDMTNPTDDFDFPTEWLEALYLNLAVKLLGFYAVKDEGFIANLKMEAKEALELAKGFDDDLESLYFIPANDQYRGTYL